MTESSAQCSSDTIAGEMFVIASFVLILILFKVKDDVPIYVIWY